MDTKQTILRYYDEVWRRGNVAAIDDLLAPEFVDETPPPGFPADREGHKLIAAGMRDGARNRTMDVLDVVADGDRGVGVWRMDWTQVGDLWGRIPADGRRIELHGLDYFQVKDGRIVRCRHVEHWMGALMQLGVFG
jgi:ketosteroid isomerase-like protein